MILAKVKEKKKIAYNNAKILYNVLLHIYNNEYYEITKWRRRKICKKYNPYQLLIKGQRLIESKKEEEKCKSHPGKTTAGRAKLRRQSRW